ncbi:hypothetical protein [Longibaculum muris]|uniref:hypothetical protein n=1 Tax=Longibaculum muris TaxID=1796628 RepID=UPI0022E5E508|nr:hypothetical protein [Longibaculum muris]
MVYIIKKIFPEYKSKKELKKEIETLNYYASLTKEPYIIENKYNVQPLKCKYEFYEMLSEEQIKHYMAIELIPFIENLIEIKEIECLRDRCRHTKVYEGILMFGEKEVKNNVHK